jgi:hypothetical protein
MAENLGELIVQLQDLKTNPEPYMRVLVLGLVGEVRQRIHVRGEKANGEAIGTYKNSYLKVREKYNRGTDKKKILSLTRQMEQDFVPVAEGNEYGLGYNNKHNLDKATWQEEANPGTFELSESEQNAALGILEDYLNGLFG